MTLEASVALRLQFLARVIRKECKHLMDTDIRLFAQGMTIEQVKDLEDQPELAERIEAFASRF
jgi:hypothetical protein